MYRIGVFPMKALPPHRGHLNAIIQASTLCEKLYVVVSHHPDHDKLCLDAGLPIMPLQLRARWLSTELAELDHIKVLMLDETGIPSYPYGWEEWSNRLNALVPEKINVVFGGEPSYEEGYQKYFDADYMLYDCERTAYPISATMIRKDPLKHWDYILGAARPFFAKKVLIVGTESCGKTTLTKMLAKIYHTSWAREEGRYYSTKYFGGNEDVFDIKDFFNIAWEQRQIEDHAFKTANKIAFCDTDAVVTQYYCEMYMGEQYKPIEDFVDPSRYDVVFMMRPDVKWVDDGFRWNAEQEKRNQLHEKLKQMYIDRGFKNIIEIGGGYDERLHSALDYIDSMLEGETV